MDSAADKKKGIFSFMSRKKNSSKITTPALHETSDLKAPAVQAETLADKKKWRQSAPVAPTNIEYFVNPSSQLNASAYQISTKPAVMNSDQTVLYNSQTLELSSRKKRTAPQPPGTLAAPPVGLVPPRLDVVVPNENAKHSPSSSQSSGFEEIVSRSELRVEIPSQGNRIESNISPNSSGTSSLGSFVAVDSSVCEPGKAKRKAPAPPGSNLQAPAPPPPGFNLQAPAPSGSNLQAPAPPAPGSNLQTPVPSGSNLQTPVPPDSNLQAPVLSRSSSVQASDFESSSKLIEAPVLPGSSAQLSTHSSIPSNEFNRVPEYSRTPEVAPSSEEYTQEISVQRNEDVNQMEEVISHISPGSSSCQHSSSRHSSSFRTLCTEENVNTVEHSAATIPSSEREISLKSSSDKLSQIVNEGFSSCSTQDNRNARGDDTKVDGSTDDTIDDEIIFDSLDVTFVKPDLPKFVASTQINSASTMESLQNEEERNCADRLEDCSIDCAMEDRNVDRAGEDRVVDCAREDRNVDRAGEDRAVDRARDRMKFNEENRIIESIEEEKRSCEVGMVSDEVRLNIRVSIPQLTTTDQNRNKDSTEENRTDDREYQGDSIHDDEDDRTEGIRDFEQQTYQTNVGQTVLNGLHTDEDLSRNIGEEDRGDDDSVEETSANEDGEKVRQSRPDQSLTDSTHQGKWEDSSESDETSGLELTDHTRDAGDGKSDNYEEDESEGGAVGEGDGRDLCDEVEIRRERGIDSEIKVSMSENVKSAIGGDAGYAAVRCDSEVRCDSKVRNFDQEDDAIKVTSEDESEMGVRDVSIAPPHVSKESEVINQVGDKSSNPSVAATIENNGQKELISESAKSKLMSILTSKISKIRSEATPKSTTYSKESTENMSNPQSNVMGSSRNNSSDSRWNKSAAGISNQNSSNDSKNKIILQKTDINAGIGSNDPSDCVGSAHFSSDQAGCTTLSDGLAHSPHGKNIPSNEDIQMESVISTDNGSDYNYFYGYDVKKEAKSNVPNHPIKSDLEVGGQKNKNNVDIPQLSNCNENMRKNVAEVKKIPKKEQERAPETKPKPNFFGPKPWVARYKQTDSSISANRTSTLARLFSKESSPPESPDTKTLNSTDDIEKLKPTVNVKDSSGYVRAETLPRNIFQTRDSCTSPEKDALSNEGASSTEISQSIPRKGSSPTGSFQISSLPGPSQDEKRTPSLPFVDLQQNLSNWHQQTRKKEAVTANKIFSSNKQNKTENTQLPQEQKSRGVATESDGTLKKKSFWRKSEVTKEQEVTKEPPLKVELNQPTVRSPSKPNQSPDVAVVSLEQLMAGKAGLRKTSSTDESIVTISSDRSFVIRSSALPPGKSILESSLPSAPSLLRSPVKKSPSGTSSPRTPTETEDVREQLMLAIQKAKGKPMQQTIAVSKE